MRFLVDAQLPMKLAQLLSDAGHDCVHTSQLPEGNRSTDAAIVALADSEDRVVVIKDRDFRDGHLLRRSPRRLLIVSTGNITNVSLLSLFADNLQAVVDSLTEAAFVEFGLAGLIVHGNLD